MTKPYLNEDRTRYYGLRVGDKVHYHPFSPNAPKEVDTVHELGYGDNNCVYLIDDKGIIFKAVAEWCNIVEKVDSKWEVFMDESHFDLFCVRLKTDRDFSSKSTFQFINKEDAEQFKNLLEKSINSF